MDDGSVAGLSLKMVMILFSLTVTGNRTDPPPKKNAHNLERSLIWVAAAETKL